MLRRRLEAGVPPETPIRLGAGKVLIRDARGETVTLSHVVLREESTATTRTARMSFAAHALDTEQTWMSLRREPRRGIAEPRRRTRIV
ncbi:MAG: hypothetical protein QM811_15840 [Pirellulales bacterium]